MPFPIRGKKSADGFWTRYGLHHSGTYHLYDCSVGEQITKELKPAFIVMFCIGVVCDTTGILLMTLIETSPLGFFETAFHIITGAAAIFLMLIHAVWAIRVLIQKDELSAARFHKFSKFVWLFWLVPFLSPMFTGMLG